ncbi:MAG: histidine phosphatase family protein [Caldithrix sp.]|nr:histidine phosphatase family protein [Caldithrix sp.]
MKTVYFMRHAKSSWKDGSLTDHERPLNKRGLKDAPLMGKLLKEKGMLPDGILVSSARRAQETCRLFTEMADYDPASVHTEEMIYENDYDILLQLIRQQPDAWQSLMIIGHNPSTQEAVNALSDQFFDKIPTAAIAAIQFMVRNWSEVGQNRGRLLFFEYPKKHK